jgi:hypothetical protein
VPDIGANALRFYLLHVVARPLSDLGISIHYYKVS